MKIDIKGKSRYFDGWIHRGYTEVKNKLIKKDWDWITIVDGLEGSGKSTICQQIAVLVDPTFKLDRIVFNPDDFKKAVHKSKPYQAIIYDEAYNTMSSGKAMYNAQKELLSMLAEIRQKNLFLFFCCPTFFDIIKNLAMWRSKTLIHCYVNENYQRGFFRAYNTAMKNQLYIEGKKFYSYRAGQKAFQSIRGRFTNWLAVPEKAYRQKKLDALSYYEDIKAEAETKTQKDRNQALRLLYHKYGMNTIDLEKGGFCLSRERIGQIVKIKPKEPESGKGEKVT